MPKLTIAIPNYNSGKNLKRAINSCKRIKLSQRDFEILVVDNHSTDNSIQIVKDLKTQFGNLRLIVNETNLGRIKNWNRCLQFAKGDYIIFLFANETITDKNNIQETIGILDDDPTISIVVSSFIKQDGNKKSVKRLLFDDKIRCPSSNFISLCLTRGILPFGIIQSILYRIKDIRKKKNYFNEEVPITADQLFSFIQASSREFILFNPVPQINWIVTNKRFHKKIKFEDLMKESMFTIDFISKKLKIDINYSLVNSHFFLSLLTSLVTKKWEGSKMNVSYLIFSYMLKKKSFFTIDTFVFKALLEKLKKPKMDSYDLLLKTIVLSTN